MKDNVIHMVKAAFHSQFKLAMENRGIAADNYFRKVNLPIEISDPEGQLPLKPFFQLINIVAIDEDMPDFGSYVAMTTPWHKVSSLGPLIQNSKSLQELLINFCEIASSQSSVVKFTLVDNGSTFEFCYSDSPIHKGDIQMELYRITSMIQLVQLATGKEWRPEKIRLNMQQNSAVNSCPLLTESDISFSQQDSTISIQADLLQLPVHIDIPATVNHIDREISEINKEFPNAIRQIIKTYSINKNISIEELANIADISVRTLQRRLAEYNLKFNELHNEAKFSHARERLHDRSLSIKEIANTLGYSDTAHFTRAFHNWSGMSPSDYRDHLAKQ
jgi:AraC-like DNA-binding protein